METVRFGEVNNTGQILSTDHDVSVSG